MKTSFMIKNGDHFDTVSGPHADLPVFNIGDQVFFQEKLVAYEIVQKSWTIHHDDSVELIYTVKKVS